MTDEHLQRVSETRETYGIDPTRRLFGTAALSALGAAMLAGCERAISSEEADIEAYAAPLTADTQSLASLRAIVTQPLPVDKAVVLRGRTTEGDGREALFVWFPTSTDADDNGITFVKPTDRGAGEAGRWKRVGKTRVYLASAVGIHPTNTPAQNSAAYAAWRDDGDAVSSTLLFDRASGSASPYKFDAALQIPAWRTLKGVVQDNRDSVWLKYEGASGLDSFIVPLGTCFLESLTITVRNGALETGLADYCVKTAGTWPTPNVAGPTVMLRNVNCMFANIACVHGYNASLGLYGVSTWRGQYGLLLVGCSEIHAIGGAYHSATVANIRLVGTGIPGGAPNGGRFVASGLVGANAPIGLDLDGVASCVIHGITMEGASTVAINIRDSTNVWIFGMRMNAGNQVYFDSSNLCCVWGGGLSGGAHVKYLNNSRMCRCFTAIESYAAPIDVDQKFGDVPGSEWIAHIRPDGRVLSVANTKPSAGYWEVGDVVWRKTPVAGQPLGWVCTGNGNPGAWIPFGMVPIAAPLAYTVSNLTTDRQYNAASTTVSELANVLGTLITDLRAQGLVG